MNYVKHDIVFDKGTYCWIVIDYLYDHVNRRTISSIHGRECVRAMMYDCHDPLVVSLTCHDML